MKIYPLCFLFLIIFNACGGGSAAQNFDVDKDGIDKSIDCNDLDAAVNPDAIDLPDDNLTDSNCDGIDGNIAKGIWVSADEGNDAFAGTIEAPVKTISKALDLASYLSSADRQVYVVAGTYPEDIIVENDISLYGGYGLLVDGIRSRNLGSQRANLPGVDGDKKITMTFNGAPVSVDYTVLVQNTTSTLDALIIDSDKNSFGTLFYDADGVVKNSLLQEKIPAALRDMSGLIAAIIGAVGTANRSVEVSHNVLKMNGNGAVGNGKNFGVLALPEQNAQKDLSLLVVDNTLTSKGDGQVAVAVAAADDDNNPNDDSATDSHASIDMVVKKNTFTMTSSHSISAGIVGGLLLESPLFPAPNYYIGSVQMIENRFSYDGYGTGAGASIGPAREESVIANNVLSLTTTKDGVYGLVSFMSPISIFYNTLSVDLPGKSAYGLLFMGSDKIAPLINYVEKTPEIVANNIFSLRSLSSATCALIGVVEGSEAAADANVNKTSPTEFKNNDIDVRGDCATKILYVDLQTVAPPGTRLEINSINNLNSKVGFRPDDPTEFASNISADPQFTNSAIGDFTLAVSSAALDAGWMFEEGWNDIAGIPRPQGVNADMGAYEK